MRAFMKFVGSKEFPTWVLTFWSVVLIGWGGFMTNAYGDTVDPTPLGDGSSVVSWSVNNTPASNNSGGAVAAPMSQKVIVRYTAPTASCSISSEALVTTVEPVVTVTNLGRGRFVSNVVYNATLDFGVSTPTVCQKTESSYVRLRCGDDVVSVQLILFDPNQGCPPH